MTQVLNTIGVAGQMRAGKDVLADYLVTKLWHWQEANWRDAEDDGAEGAYERWGRGSFASEVKRIFCSTFMFSQADIDKWKVLPEPPPGFNKPVREALTMIGDGFRDIMGDVWIRRAFLDRENPSWPYKRIFSDVRYLNEARKIRSVGGPNILVCRPSHINYVANRSESEVRPYVEWCLSTGREGLISEWPEFQSLLQSDGEAFPLRFRGDNYEQVGESIFIPVQTFAENLSLFDVFIINDGTVEDFQKKSVDLIIPILKKNFGYGKDLEKCTRKDAPWL